MTVNPIIGIALIIVLPVAALMLLFWLINFCFIKPKIKAKEKQYPQAGPAIKPAIRKQKSLINNN